MQTIFSTEALRAQDRFEGWHQVCDERLVPLDHRQLVDDAFSASIDGARVGGLTFTRFALSNLRIAATPRTIRHQDNKSSQIYVTLMLSGSVHVDQGGTSTEDRAGDFSIRDQSQPWVITYPEPARILAVEIPRSQLESLLGPARHFAGLTVDGALPTTTLARSFLCDLMRIGDRLTPEAAERMTSVGIELVAASLAERMALETPRPLQGTLTVQRAKSYIETNLGQVDLDPAQVAAAAGVSLRHLQALFRERGRHVADWIWERRLQVAAQRLADPGLLHLQLGAVAYACGFVNQSHFARRFRDRFDLSPRDYRRQAVLDAAARTAAA